MAAMESELTAIVCLMPDEILIKIFYDLDAVSRIKVKRVCQRWNSILTHTSVLQKYVKIDSRYQTTEGVPDVPYWNPDFEASWRLLRTVQLVLRENPLVEQLHVKNEEHSVDGGETMDIVELDVNADEVCYALLDPYKWEERDLKLPGRLVLENFPVPASNLHHFLWMVSRNDHPRKFMAGRSSVTVDLRNVDVVDLGLYNRWSDDKFPRDKRERAVTRRTSCQLVCGDGRDDEIPIFLAKIQQREPALTADEEKQYLAAVSGLDLTRSNPAEELRRVLRETFEKRVTLAEILDGSKLTALEKRVIIAGRYTLARWDENASAAGTRKDVGAEQPEVIVIEDEVPEIITVDDDDDTIVID